MPLTIAERPYQGATPDPAAATRDALQVAKSGRIPLVEIFYSLQGEGLRTGQATLFVRTAGCNCDCWFCDTDFRVREERSRAEVLARIVEIGGECRWVCLTGGEPTILDLAPLCADLHARGYKIQVETNGSRPRPDWNLDHVTVSPKIAQGARLDSWYLEHATEFKHVIDTRSDVAAVLELAARHGKPTFLQPNALDPKSIQLCIEAVQAHPQTLRLSLQTHKFLQIR